MVCDILKPYLADIQKYCDENNLDYDKLMSTEMAHFKGTLTFHMPVGKNELRGLADDKPLPLVLFAIKEADGGMSFVQTDCTKQCILKSCLLFPKTNSTVHLYANEFVFGKIQLSF